MNNDEEIANVVAFWMTFIGIILGASILGLIVGIIEAFINNFLK